MAPTWDICVPYESHVENLYVSHMLMLYVCRIDSVWRVVGQGLGSYAAERHPKRRNRFCAVAVTVGVPPVSRRPRLIGHIFGSIARMKRRTAKIMAPYYKQLFTANPMALTPLSVDDLEGVISRSQK